jgi:cell division protein FtsA
MDKHSDYIAGIDLGTSKVRVVVGTVGENGAISVVGYGEGVNSGMKKGVVIDLAGPAETLNKVLGEVDQMAGTELHHAVFGVSGEHVMSTRVDGMVALSGAAHEISHGDIDWVNRTALTGKVPPNREALEFAPYGYSLDGESSVRDPLGMTGTRLEVKANAITGLKPYCDNVRKVAEMTKVTAVKLTPGVLAAARVVLTEQQMENGVALVDMGAATTSVAIFEGGDLQYVAVVPVGSGRITNDLAMVLKVPIETAEEIKTGHVTMGETSAKPIVLKRGQKEQVFKRPEVMEIMEAALSDDILLGVRRELKRAGYDRKLPEGVVLIGGGAKLKGIEAYAKEQLELAVKLGAPRAMAGVSAEVEKPEYATAVGLMVSMLQVGSGEGRRGGGGLKRLLGKIFGGV